MGLVIVIPQMARRSGGILGLLVASAAPWLVVPAAHAQVGITGSEAVRPMADDSLFQAFGGRPGLERLMADFVPRLKADARIGAMFKDTNADELRRQLVDQLCVISGGPCMYRGAGMKAVHADFDISKADFNALVELLQRSMAAQGIPFAVQNRMLAQLAPMHREVINVR
jgi:hemoglobin